MNIKITSKDGVTLKTKGKYCKEDISVAVDESLMGITPTGTYQVTDNGEYDITEYAKVNVNVASSGGESTLKKLLDYSKSCYRMFCKNTGIFDLTDYFSYNDTENVTNTSEMFYQCSKLTTIPLFNTSNVTNMSYMFYGCLYLTSVPQLDTSNVTDMNRMFYQCYKLTTIPLFNTSNVTNMSYMFAMGQYGTASKLTTIPQLDTSKVTNMSSMFEQMESLTSVPQLDTSNVTDMSYMFRLCKNLTSVPQLNTSNVTDMNYMFYGCSKLTSVKLDTTKCTAYSSTFYNCYEIETIDLSYFYCQYANYSDKTFYNCYSLKTIILRGIGNYCVLNANTFNNCYHLTGTVDATYNPNGDKDGYIYVPRSKVDTLKSSTNWSTYADQIRALEDYTIDGTTTGELDESKI